MALMFKALEAVCVLVAAIVVGNWFLGEVRKTRVRKAPWYTPYLSLPGMLILLILIVPVVLWAIQR